ncbi:MAG: hypothetical protein ACE366_26985 [Bradymonadia bacterium]
MIIHHPHPFWSQALPHRGRPQTSPSHDPAHVDETLQAWMTQVCPECEATLHQRPSWLDPMSERCEALMRAAVTWWSGPREVHPSPEALGGLVAIATEKSWGRGVEGSNTLTLRNGIVPWLFAHFSPALIIEALATVTGISAVNKQGPEGTFVVLVRGHEACSTDADERLWHETRRGLSVATDVAWQDALQAAERAFTEATPPLKCFIALAFPEHRLFAEQALVAIDTPQLKGWFAQLERYPRSDEPRRHHLRALLTVCPEARWARWLVGAFRGWSLDDVACLGLLESLGADAVPVLLYAVDRYATEHGGISGRGVLMALQVVEDADTLVHLLPLLAHRISSANDMSAKQIKEYVRLLIQRYPETARAAFSALNTPLAQQALGLVGRWPPLGDDTVSVEVLPPMPQGKKQPKPPRFVVLPALSRPRTATGAALDDPGLTHLLALARVCPEGSAELDAVCSAFTADSLADFAWSLYLQWTIHSGAASTRWMPRALVWTATVTTLDRLEGAIESWQKSSALKLLELALDVCVAVGGEAGRVQIEAIIDGSNHKKVIKLGQARLAAL